MPVLSRAAQLVREYRAARMFAAMTSTSVGALSPMAALAQDVNTPTQVAQAGARFFPAGTTSIKPPMPLGPHCEVIKAAFELVEFDGAYGKRANAWLANKCDGDVPLPDPGLNGKRFNAAAGVLARRFDIHLTP